MKEKLVKKVELYSEKIIIVKKEISWEF